MWNDLRADIVDMFSVLTDIPSPQREHLFVVPGDTGQATMLVAKREYMQTAKGRAARKRHDSKPERKAANLARMRAKRAKEKEAKCLRTL